MKKLFFAILLSIFLVNVASAACKYVPCRGYIQTTKATATSKVTTLYAKLTATLAKLGVAYTKYELALTEQRKLLEDLQTLKSNNALLEKEILFVRGIDNEVIGLTIDSVAAKKEME